MRRGVFVGFRIRPDSPPPLNFRYQPRKNTAGFREEYRRPPMCCAAEFRHFQGHFLAVSAGYGRPGQGPLSSSVHSAKMNGAVDACPTEG